MTGKFDERVSSPALEQFRDELGDEFVRVARSRSGPRVGKRARRGGFAILAAAIAIPGAVALASQFGGSSTPVLVPMPAPANSPGSASTSTCPKEAKDFVFEVLAGEKTVSDYQQSPGYPVEGCPTAEDLQSFLQQGGSK
jgi:hypothetical protein